MADIYFARHAKRKQRQRSVIGRFLPKILVNPDKLFEGTPCWEWVASIDDGGYGRFKGFGENYAHRVAYLYFVGDIPEGHEIDHRCMNRKCQSPFHMQTVTHTANQALRTDIKTRCINGHPYDRENTHVNVHGHRVCKTCRYEAIKRWRQNHPEQAREVYRQDKAQYRAKGGIW